MPDRKVKAEINRSSSLSSVSEGAELLFRQLIHYVDSKGCGDARIPQIVAGCCPLRRRNDVESVTQRRLGELVSEGCVDVSTENGRPRLKLTGWDIHQSKSSRSRSSKSCLFPTDHESLSKISSDLYDWWSLPSNVRQFGHPEIHYAVETCSDWSHGNNRKRANWVLVLKNGVKSGWLRPKKNQTKFGGAVAGLHLLSGGNE